MTLNTPDPVRQLVLRTMRELGAAEEELARMTDTLLIREGHYCGRSFRTPGMMAMWIAGLIQFYGPNGEMLATVSLREEPEQQSKAA